MNWYFNNNAMYLCMIEIDRANYNIFMNHLPIKYVLQFYFLDCCDQSNTNVNVGICSMNVSKS